LKQLVDDEEVIGTLIEANDRLINALELYDKLSTPNAGSPADSADDDGNLHPDLLGTLGSSSLNLAEPLRPSVLSDDGDQSNEDYAHGLLPDSSDYDFSDADNGAGSSRTRDRVTVSDDERD
jgi:hypothetical protein